MARKTNNCTICENSNQPSICSICVNYKLNEYYTTLKSLKERRDFLYSKLSQVLVRKGKGDDQTNWRVLRHEKLARLREKLHHSQQQVTQGRAKNEAMSADLKLKYGVLDSALSMLEKNRVEQLEKFYPNLICTQSLGHGAITAERLHKQSVVIKQICKLFPLRQVVVNIQGKDELYDQICNALLPRAVDPKSVPPEDLSVSLGYMVQLLNLVVHNLAAPALHNTGFAGSCSRIWQRDSYWDARPSSRSNEYPLFIHRQYYCSPNGGENSWSDKSSSNFGVASMESDRRPRLDSSGNVPSEASTFEAFAKLLATLSSSKEVQSVFSLKMARSRTCKQVQQLNKSVWNMNSAISSSTLQESAHYVPTSRIENYMPSSAASFLYPTDSSDRKRECLIEGWDIVEHPTLPPPPSQTEDVEHWTRAMFIDAKRR
ncbi:unnamed protein product [Vicia faba]|uniref:DNA-directed RNA polymerase II protein n=1 Tax=Vicia faba TaxID=3906 RepID=A0AAV0YI62_VICFA|nr:unnamed protein product [Vicia faba]